MQVASELDVITLRQMIRHLGKELGMSLTLQARFTAAISAVARQLLTTSGGARFTIQVTGEDGDRDRDSSLVVLEVLCLLPADMQVAGDGDVAEVSIYGATHGATHGAPLPPPVSFASFHFDEIYALVDDALLAVLDGQPYLKLRMQLSH